MKKSYLMIAAAAALFAACAENDKFKDIDAQETAISFNSFTQNVTKGAIVGSTAAITKKALADEGGFVVYGYKTKDSWATINQTVFNEVNVKSDDDGATWYYDRLRFWDKNGIYNFYAVAPYNPDHGTYSINVASRASGHDDYDADAPLKNSKFGYITITGAQSAISDDSDDFLLARAGATDEDGASHTNTTNNTVDFEFHHVMAKVTFKLKSTLSSGKITVTSLRMIGWDNGEGTFVQNSKSTPSALNKDEWTISSAVDGDITLVGGTATDDEIELTCSASATATDVTDWYIMVPQAIAANTLKFIVSYTYLDDNGTATTDDDYTEPFIDQEATVTAAHIWGTDSHTSYTLDIKPAEIKFDVESICNFCVDGGNVDTQID